MIRGMNQHTTTIIRKEKSRIKEGYSESNSYKLGNIVLLGQVIHIYFISAVELQVTYNNTRSYNTLIANSTPVDVTRIHSTIAQLLPCFDLRFFIFVAMSISAVKVLKTGILYADDLGRNDGSTVERDRLDQDGLLQEPGDVAGARVEACWFKNKKTNFHQPCSPSFKPKIKQNKTKQKALKQPREQKIKKIRHLACNASR
jgi:hypothetical protein